MPKPHQPSEVSPLGRRLGPAASACMYCAALASGVLLIAVGRATPVEASGYIAPFLVVFERLTGRR
ncbi:hypothetical protein [Streptomyces sp. NPDC004100]